MRNIIVLIFTAVSFISFSQDLINNTSKTIKIQNDTTILDSLSISQNGFSINTVGGIKLDSNLYKIDFARSLLIVDKQLIGQEVNVKYKTFPINFSKKYFHKNYDEVTKAALYNKPVKYSQFYTNTTNDDFFGAGNLNKSGSISRGVTVGNNQNAVVNSSLNLQMSGKISENISILAAITDDNIPIQPDGSSQQIREFDKIYISLFDKNNKLTVGDFQIQKPVGYFMNFNKKLQGASFETNVHLKKNRLFKSTISGALAKGKYNRMQVVAIEGNQGPYRLQGAENEMYIIVLSGTEKVYIDGRLLTRGQENDYIINYNTGEITFTPKQPITKDKRIIVEFEYSDKNYARFTIFNGNEYRTKNANLYLNIFSESDSRNQPINQTLNDNEKLILSQIGDSLQNAVVYNIDSVGFNDDEILYKKIDSLGYSNVYVYSTNADSAVYRLGFSYVGQNNGNYIKTSTATNGKVFKWVEPVANVPQGDYEPVRVLITPKKTQMATFGGNVKITKNLSTSFELAVSSRDLNTFSDIDNGNNDGYALKFGLQKVNYFTDTTAKITTNVNYSYIQDKFSAIERFKTSEFNRDWNINNINLTQEEQQVGMQLKFSKIKFGNVSYNIDFMNKGSDYTGLRNGITSHIDKKGFIFDFRGSYLKSESLHDNYEFLRYYGTLAKRFKLITIGTHIEQEQNIQKRDTLTDLLPTSFNYLQWEVFANNTDTTNNKFFTKYIHRDDYMPLNNSLKHTTQSNDIQAGANFFKNRKNIIKTLLNIRKLDIVDSNLTIHNAENSLTARIEHTARILKGVIVSTIFYETGTGLEEKREYSYLKVPAGQGIYVWIDHNENGIKELDEFEIAVFADEAEYIRIYTPSNDFIKVYTNQLSHTININPKRKWFNKDGVRGFIARFSDMLAYKFNNKSTLSDFPNSINPFYTTTDSTMISISNSVRNTLSFNKTATVWGIDYIFNNLNNRLLTVNGLDSKYLNSNGLRLRVNPINTITLINLFTLGLKKFDSQFFTTKNYNINYYENKAELAYQPNVKFRVSALYNYSDKQNTIGPEKSKTNDFGLEFRFNAVNKGNLSVKINLIKIDYNQTNSTPIAYEMLQGLFPGDNATWTVMYQRNLNSYLQLNLNYSGRYSEDIPVVHTGNVQLRAFF